MLLWRSPAWDAYAADKSAGKDGCAPGGPWGRYGYGSPIDVVGFGVLFAEDDGVADPELVGVIDLDTGVGGLSFCKQEENQRLEE